MPQEFQVLRCFSCEKFQVHQTKKAKKWQCKVCGEKQSLKKAYFIGSAKDCRTNVQQLNFEDGQQKQDCMLQQNNESFAEDTLFDSVVENTDAYELENISFESIQSNWNNTTAFIDDKILCMPKKKRKYTEDFLPEICNEDVMYGDFEEPQKGDMVQSTNISLGTPCQETSVSFDVSFDGNSKNSITDTSTFESTDAPLKLNNAKDEKINLEPPLKKCRDSKNRGFQLIMTAAKKLSADTDLF